MRQRIQARKNIRSPGSILTDTGLKAIVSISIKHKKMSMAYTHHVHYTGQEASINRSRINASDQHEGGSVQTLWSPIFRDIQKVFCSKEGLIQVVVVGGAI